MLTVFASQKIEALEVALENTKVVSQTVYPCFSLLKLYQMAFNFISFAPSQVLKGLTQLIEDLKDWTIIIIPWQVWSKISISIFILWFYVPMNVHILILLQNGCLDKKANDWTYSNLCLQSRSSTELANTIIHIRIDNFPEDFGLSSNQNRSYSNPWVLDLP